MKFETLFLAAAYGVNFAVCGKNGITISADMIDIPYWLKVEIAEWSVAYAYENIDVAKHDAEGFALAHKLKKYMPDTLILYCSILDDSAFTHHEID